jgi:hypothetical protein
MNPLHPVIPVVIAVSVWMKSYRLEWSELLAYLRNYIRMGGCTRAEGRALRRRNLTTGWAAGIRHGRAQFDPASKLILAVKRKILGFGGRAPI